MFWLQWNDSCFEKLINEQKPIHCIFIEIFCIFMEIFLFLWKSKYTKGNRKYRTLPHFLDISSIENRESKICRLEWQIKKNVLKDGHLYSIYWYLYYNFVDHINTILLEDLQNRLNKLINCTPTEEGENANGKMVIWLIKKNQVFFDLQNWCH